ncbi:MAG TPA: hypothetical protein VKR23_01585 [Gaiellaceae bacterium]|nr:hypothetical protein [Gaiellaceae bacterium]
MLVIADKRPAPARHQGEALLCRYLDLTQLGFSSETSAIIAQAGVPLSSVARLMLPEDVDTAPAAGDESQ